MENDATPLCPINCFVNVMDCFMCLKPLAEDMSVHLSCHHGLHLKCMVAHNTPTTSSLDVHMKSEVLVSPDEILFRFVNATASPDDQKTDNTLFCRFCHSRSTVITTSFYGNNFADSIFKPFSSSSIPFTSNSPSSPSSPTKPPSKSTKPPFTKDALYDKIVSEISKKSSSQKSASNGPTHGPIRAPSSPIAPPLRLPPSAVGASSNSQYYLSNHYLENS